MNNSLDKCNICPRLCNVNRNNNELGFCKCNNEIKIANYSLHMWEEPCISGKEGSGTVFFCGCPLRCIFCQNHVIALGKEKTGEKIGKEIIVKETFYR